MAREAEQDPTMNDTAATNRFGRPAGMRGGMLIGLRISRVRVTEWHTSAATAQSWIRSRRAEYPRCDDPQNRSEGVTAWRTALVAQMLTRPRTRAPSTGKRPTASRPHRHVGVKDETLQRAIDADVEWLEAHPVAQIHCRITSSQERLCGGIPARVICNHVRFMQILSRPPA